MGQFDLINSGKFAAVEKYGMMMLREDIGGVEVLNEQTSQGRVVFLEGPMLMATHKNRNNRIYPKDILERAVEAYQRDYINERRAIGELNHPDYPMPDPKKAALKIESLYWQGDAVIGKARVLNTPDGLIIKELVDVDYKIGASTRGLGDVRKESGGDIVNRYMLNAIDAVDMPSGQICYLNKVNESVKWVYENGVWVQKLVEGHTLKPNQIELLEALGVLLKSFKTK